MGRRAKPSKGKADPKRSPARKPPKSESARVRDLEKRLAESLEREKATAEILSVISTSPTDVQPVFDVVAESAARLCDSFDAAIYRREADRLVLVGYHGQIGEREIGVSSLSVSRGTGAGRAVLERRAVHVLDMQAEVTDFPESSANARRRGFRALLSVPLIKDGLAIGAIVLLKTEARLFTDQQIALLRTFADQAVIAIENVCLFKELEVRNRDLTESLEQQTATAEILRVISTSPTKLQPVLDEIVKSAARFCGAPDASILRLDGGHLRAEAHHGPVSLPRGFLLPLVRGTVGGRSVLERQAVSVTDLQGETDEYPEGSALASQNRQRATLSVPLLREGVPIGVILLRRAEAVPFTDKQIALSKIFADQAVIAIENVRLFSELQEKNEALTQAHAQVTESLEQQTATSEILRVISSSPTDVQPVFDALAESAARLCAAFDSAIWRREGDRLLLAAHHGAIPQTGSESFLPLVRGTVGGRSVLDGRTVLIADIQIEADEFPETSKNAQRQGWRSILSVPLMREGVALGAIVLRRTEAQLFTGQQVVLLETFADQAVIAIENVRLFNETKEALEQQTATSEILRVISSSPGDIQPVFDAIAANAARLCDAVNGLVIRFDGQLLHLAAHHNVDPERLAAVRQAYPRPPSRGALSGRAILTRAVVHVPDVSKDPEYTLPTATTIGYRSVLAVPMMHEGVARGTILVARDVVAPFSETHIALIQTFADQAVIAIENVRLFNETKEALERQTATSEILRVISQSPTDVQPVFDAIAESARQLCNGEYCVVESFDGERLHFGASDGLSPEGLAAFRQALPRPVSEDNAAGRAVLRRMVAQIPDVLEDPTHGVRGVALAANYRSAVAVPMLRHGQPIGAIVVARSAVGSFPERQIELLKTFADQAVIAIENVRLFTELQEKNKALTEAHAQVTESLEQQTATSEILRVISSSPTSVEAVFDTILANALRLCETPTGGVFTFDGRAFHLAAAAHWSDEFLAALREAAIVPGPETPLRRVGITLEVSHVADIFGDPSFSPAAAYRLEGMRTSLAVPMLKEGRLIGALTFHRREVRPFTEAQIALIKIFADQAVIAIENVRLFKELEARNRDLTEALDQQTATSEILRVISSSPTDVQPVLDTVVASAARFCGAYDVTLFRVDGDRLRFPAHYGPIPVPEEGSISLIRGHVSGRSVLERRVVHLADVQAEAAEFPEGAAYAQRHGHRTIVAAPLLREGAAIGALLLRRGEASPFSDKQIALLQTFADQAVIAIENVRLFKELEARNRDLTEALEQQTATSDVLRIIAQSPTELQPVLDAIASSAVRLCAASDVVIERLEGDRFYNAAHAGTQMKGLVGHPLPLTRRFPGGRAVLDRRPVIIDDIMLVAETEYPDTLELLRLNTVHSCAEIPLLSEGRSLGNLAVLRAEVRPFTDAEVALLQTFADQAVIAIENVRLFKELEARTQDLTRSVGELRALGEVGQAISSTLKLPTVLSTIVARATELAAADAGVIYEYDEEREVFLPRASERLETEIVETMLAAPVRKGEGATGRLAEVQQPIQLPDIFEAPAESRVRHVLGRAGYRALLAVPLVREGRLLGGLTVIRKATGEFTPEVIDLMRTFATQSALAIQNARLFREIEIKSRQLEVASQHKSEFLANMSHELRTPLNAIIGFSEVLTDRMFGELNEKQDEYLKDIYASGTHLLSLINDILDLSKIEAGRMELELTEFDLPTAIENALMLVRERAQRRSLTLSKDVDAGVGQIQGDERKIRQVVLNLLSNAIKFTPEGGRIELAAVPKDGIVEVSVSDTGVGIAPEDQEKVFEEFRQVGSADMKAEGTGLGLTLCR